LNRATVRYMSRSGTNGHGLSTYNGPGFSFSNGNGPGGTQNELWVGASDPRALAMFGLP